MNLIDVTHTLKREDFNLYIGTEHLVTRQEFINFRADNTNGTQFGTFYTSSPTTGGQGILTVSVLNYHFIDASPLSSIKIYFLTNTKYAIVIVTATV